jgi:hypothetical protein
MTKVESLSETYIQNRQPFIRGAYSDKILSVRGSLMLRRKTKHDRHIRPKRITLYHTAVYDI